MNENSPICASEAVIISAAERECPNRRTTRKAATDLPTRMMSTVASSASGAASTIVGSNSMPTETKNSTAKASRNGSDSVAACWLSCDSLSIMPAKKAPSASEMPNSSAAA